MDYLAQLPWYCLLLLTSGLWFPIPTIAIGGVYFVLRIVYPIGKAFQSIIGRLAWWGLNILMLALLGLSIAGFIWEFIE